MKNLLRDLHEKAVSGPLDPSKPPPDGFGNPAQLWEPHVWIAYQDHFREPEEDETSEGKQIRQQKLAECKVWEVEERGRYEVERKKIEADAQLRAEKKIPNSLDISFLGGGWAFLLEFSTVIVIIFALLVLAVLHTLDGKEISTILAAIAGYVLGKASAGATSGQSDSSRDNSSSSRSPQ
jgi:hypothetical protein